MKLNISLHYLNIINFVNEYFSKHEETMVLLTNNRKHLGVTKCSALSVKCRPVPGVPKPFSMRTQTHLLVIY
jgi:hypothetical protein